MTRVTFSIQDSAAAWLVANDPLRRRSPAYYAKDLVLDAVIAARRAEVEGPPARPPDLPPPRPSPARPRGVVPHQVRRRARRTDTWSISRKTKADLDDKLRRDDVVLVLTEGGRVKFRVPYSADLPTPAPDPGYYLIDARRAAARSGRGAAA